MNLPAAQLYSIGCGPRLRAAHAGYIGWGAGARVARAWRAASDGGHGGALTMWAATRGLRHDDAEAQHKWVRPHR
jgi:hypothetical protein